MSCIKTFSGKFVDPLNATAEDINIKDIAHALSLLCRANGHLPHFYSVAQHSINCAKEAATRGYSMRVQLACLLHDASEAYLSDITRPVKPLLPNYLEIEKKLQDTIYNKWISPALTEPELAQIQSVDNAILYFEFLSMMDERLSDEPLLKSRPNFVFEDFADVENCFTYEFKKLTDSGTYVGVDLMGGKWLAVEIASETASYRVFDDISSLCTAYIDIPEILIDVPIGLPESAEEALLRPDSKARNYLKVKSRKSSVFNTPFRQMVYASSTQEAWELRNKLGAKISMQGLGILPCIKQVDMFLQNNPDWKLRLIESHPECAFQALNNNVGLLFSKHTDEGLQERYKILSKHISNIDDLISAFPKKQREDLFDALSLALTSKFGFENIGEQTASDALGIPMRIVVAKKY